MRVLVCVSESGPSLSQTGSLLIAMAGVEVGGAGAGGEERTGQDPAAST